MRQLLRSEMRMPSLPYCVFTDMGTLHLTSFSIGVLYVGSFNICVLYAKPFNPNPANVEKRMNS